MRRVFAFVFLLLLAAGAFLGARWLVRRGEIKVTVLVSDAGVLRRGDPVLERGTVIGRVTRIDEVDERDAVTFRLGREHRTAVLTDSLFTIEGHSLVVTNTFAFGRPVEDGAVLRAKEDRISRFLAKNAQALRPHVERLRARAKAMIENDFDEWTRKVPEWKKEGREAFDRHLEDAKKKIDEMEDELLESNRLEEAKRLRERFEQWLEEVKK